MKRRQPRTLPQVPATPRSEEIQQGAGRSPAADDRLKRGAKRNPQRDEPRIDSIEPGETPR